jgi:proton glutamate symport protein
MIVVPLVVSSLIVGVASLGDSRQLGRMSGKVLAYFLFLMALSAVLGAGLALFLHPGNQLQHAVLSADPSGVIHELTATPRDLKTLFFDMIPQNPMEALAKANLVPVIVFTLLFGAAIASIGEACRPLVSFFEAIFAATMKLTDWIMILAVPGVFSLAFITVAKSGLDVFSELWIYGIALLGGLFIQVLVIFPLMLQVLAKINFMNLYRAISEAIMVAFGTASSSATLPITIACCERRAGISNRIASFVLPTGATINKTATTMFEVLAVIFLAQAYNLHLSPYNIVMIIVFSIVASIGAAGIPSAGLITMSIVLNSVGMDASKFAVGIAMLWSIDRVLDMCRTVVNVMSSCTVAALVASSEGELNRDILNNHDAWTEVV